MSRQVRTAWEITANGGEVERRNRENKSFKRAVLNAASVGAQSDLCMRTMKQLRTSMYPRHSAVAAESKVPRRISPQSGKSRQAKSENEYVQISALPSRQ